MGILNFFFTKKIETNIPFDILKSKLETYRSAHFRIKDIDDNLIDINFSYDKGNLYLWKVHNAKITKNNKNQNSLITTKMYFYYYIFVFIFIAGIISTSVFDEMLSLKNALIVWFVIIIILIIFFKFILDYHSGKFLDEINSILNK